MYCVPIPTLFERNYIKIRLLWTKPDCVWFTDGKGRTSARHNLEESFDVMEHVYNINDMENGIITEVFK